MLHRLTLTNFQQHKKLEVQFTQGLNAIIGVNDIGKSTVLRGIMFALIGLQGVKENAQQIWNNKASKSEEFSVGLTLTLPSVGRVTITRTPTGAKVINEQGVLLASGTTPVTKLVEEAMGVSLKDLRTLCCSYQKETDGLLSIGAASLQKKVEDLSKVSTIDKALNLILTDLNKLEGALEALPKTDELTSLYAKRTEGETLLKTLSEAEEEAIREVSLREGLFSSINSSLTLMQEHFNKVNQITHQQASLLGQLEQLNKQESEQLFTLQGLPCVTPLIISDLEEQKTILTNAVNSLNLLKKSHDDRNKYQNRINELMPIITTSIEAREQVQHLELEGARHQERYTMCANSYNEAVTQHKTLSSILKSATCPTCNQDTGTCDKEHVKRDLENVEKVLEARKKDLDDSKQNIQVHNRLAASLNTKINLQAEAEYSHLLSLVQGELSAYDLILHSKLNSDLGILVADIKNKNTLLLSKTKVESLLESLSSQKKALRGNLNSVEDTMKELEKVVLPYLTLNDAKQALTEAKQNLDKAKTTLHNLQTQLAAVTEQLKWLTAQIGNLEKAKKIREESLQDQYEITSLQTYLRKNRTRLSSQIWGGILNYASALISNTTGGKFGNLQRSDKGAFTLDKFGEPVDLLYGANESVVAVALTVALSKTFFGNGLFLLLDEPTAYADNATAASVAGMLKSLNMQVVIVSHRIGDVNQCDNVIEIGE